MMFLRFNDYNHPIYDIFLIESHETEIRQTKKRKASTFLGWQQNQDP